MGGLILAASAAGCGEASNSTSKSNGPATALPVGAKPAQPGLELHGLVTAAQRRGINAEMVGTPGNKLLLLEFDPGTTEALLVGKPQKGMSAHDALQTHELDVVIGSGFVSELHSLQPVGLLQVDGQTFNPVQGHGYTRILGISDYGMGVVHKEAYHRDLFHSALQAGPGIIEEGALDISERDLQRPKYFRSFIAVCDARWLAGISLAPTHLRTLGETLTQHIHTRGWQCADAVNLAGDRQALLVLRSGDAGIVYHGDPDTYKVSLFGFRARSPH